jgi:hypothetical protein
VVAGLSTLPVPKPVFVDAEAGLLAYVKLSGVPLIDHPVAEPARLTPALGRFLSCLHQAPLGKVEELVGALETSGGRIQAVHNVRNPDKLRAVPNLNE